MSEAKIIAIGDNVVINTYPEEKCIQEDSV